MRTDENGINASLPPGLTWDLAKAKESIQKQAALGPRIVCPGHGPVLMDAIGKFPI
jgi:glyoxylase-like metal-dependent hydrolase (beta-lactamase superfamily II)